MGILDNIKKIFTEEKAPAKEVNTVASVPQPVQNQPPVVEKTSESKVKEEISVNESQLEPTENMTSENIPERKPEKKKAKVKEYSAHDIYLTSDTSIMSEAEILDIARKLGVSSIDTPHTIVELCKSFANEPTILSSFVDSFIAGKWSDHAFTHMFDGEIGITKEPAKAQSALRLFEYGARKVDSGEDVNATHITVPYLSFVKNMAEHGYNVIAPDIFEMPKFQSLLQEADKMQAEGMESFVFNRLLSDPNTPMLAGHYVDVDDTLIQKGKLNEKLYRAMQEEQSKGASVTIFTGANNKIQENRLKQLGVDTGRFHVINKSDVKNCIILGTVVDDHSPSEQGFAVVDAKKQHINPKETDNFNFQIVAEPKRPENIDNDVFLVVARHDEAAGRDISGGGAVGAYMVGKYLNEDIPVVRHMFFSPIDRTRNTAFMQRIGMIRNGYPEPSWSYNTAFHESSRDAVGGLKDVIEVGRNTGVKSLEIITHAPIVSEIAQYFGDNFSPNFGGYIIIRAKSWEDMANKQIKEVRHTKSSHQLMAEKMGKKSYDTVSSILKGSFGGFERDIVWLSYLENIKEDLARSNKTYPKDRNPVIEALDAQMFWVANLATAVGLQGMMPSKIKDEILGISAQSFGEKFFLNNESCDDYTYPIFNAVAKRLEKEKGISPNASVREAGNQVVADMLEYFPGYRQAMLVGEERNDVPDGKGGFVSGSKYYIADGDDGEGHPVFNAMAYRMLKQRQGK